MICSFIFFSGDIIALRWSSDSRILMSTGGTDKMIRVWHNPVGVEASLRDLEVKLQKAHNASMKVGFYFFIVALSKFRIYLCNAYRGGFYKKTENTGAS